MEMDVVVHEHIGVDFHLKLSGFLSEQVEVVGTVVVIKQGGTPIHTTLRHM